MYGHQGQVGGQTSRVEGSWRFSTSGHTVVAAGDPLARGVAAKVETRDFFATQEIVDSSNAALERVGSPLRLEPSADVPVPLRDKGLLRVSPVRVFSNSVETKQLRGDELLSVTECNVVADLLAGEGNWRAVYRTADSETERGQSLTDVEYGLAIYPRLLTRPQLTVPELVKQLPHDNDDHIEFTWRNPDGAEFPIKAIVTSDENEGDSAAKKEAVRQLTATGLNPQTAETLGRIINASFVTSPVVQQLFIDLVRTKAVFGPEPIDDLPTILRAARDELKAQLGQPYPPYDDANAETRRAIAERFGVNEAVAPRVGEVFAILSTRTWTPQEKALAADAEAKYPDMLPWTYHLAIVIAVDGGARITLENYNRRDDQHGPARWYFSMYGPEPERLFHSQHAPETAAPITLLLRKPAKS